MFFVSSCNYHLNIVYLNRTPRWEFIHAERAPLGGGHYSKPPCS